MGGESKERERERERQKDNDVSFLTAEREEKKEGVRKIDIRKDVEAERMRATHRSRNERCCKRS